MTAPRPFMDGPFRLQMGLRALAPADWLDRTPDALRQIPARHRLLRERSDDVTLALDESLPAQSETLALVQEHLRVHHPVRPGSSSGPAAWPTRGDAAGDAAMPLGLAGRLVAEDLCLMEARGDDSYRLTAGVLCFPLHWSLREKLGRPIDMIHEPVPGFGERLSTPVERFFHSLEPDRLVWRANWSLVDTDQLFLPPAHRGTASGFDRDRPGSTLWLRTEHQTLRRLPATRAILFTIRTRVEPLEDVMREPGVARALAARVREMPEATARYKGIVPIRRALLAYLDQFSNGGCGSMPSGLSATG